LNPEREAAVTYQIDLFTSDFTCYKISQIRAFKNVVAQFIGQLCLMNQATTKSGMAAKQSQWWA